MKYLIASDIHGSAYYTQKIIEEFNKITDFVPVLSLVKEITYVSLAVIETL